MAEIINLKSVRKAKSRTEKEKAAEANRAKFGRTKAERSRSEADDDRLNRTLDNARIDDTP